MNSYCSIDGMSKPMIGSSVKPVISADMDYLAAKNKPSINGVTLIGNKTNEELLIAPIPNTEIDEILKNLN